VRIVTEQSHWSSGEQRRRQTWEQAAAPDKPATKWSWENIAEAAWCGFVVLVILGGVFGFISYAMTPPPPPKYQYGEPGFEELDRRWDMTDKEKQKLKEAVREAESRIRIYGK
jgi:ABC-type Fe3+ transport system permease subunit